MGGQLIFGQRIVPFKEIKEGSFRKAEFTTYEGSILAFCHKYLNNQSYFHIATSGSTGHPKTVKIGRNQMQASAQMTGKKLDINQNIEALLCINASFIGGTMMLVRAMEFHWNLTVIGPTSNPYSSDLKPFDFLALVPLQLNEIAANVGATLWAQKATAILVGGAPLDSTLEAIIESWPVPIYHTFGMTETVSHIALRRLTGKQKSGFYSLLDGILAKIDDRGCLVLKSKVTNDLWVTTNDLVEMVDTKHFSWLGRIDYVINSGGYKVVPELIEEEITSILQDLRITNSFFITGLPDPKLGQKVTLIMEGNSIGILKKVQNALRGKLHPFEIPNSIVFIKQFSRAKNQKISRNSTLNKI